MDALRPLPPYDAVRLLMEMEEVARERILAVFPCNSAVVDCLVTLEKGKTTKISGTIYRDVKLRADYVINGHKMTSEVSWYDAGNGVEQHRRDELKQKIAEDIAFMMLSPAWDRMLLVTLPK